MSNDSLIHALAGSTGGIVAMTATYPLIFLNTRAAVETSKEQKSVYQAVLDVLKREGLAGLFDGFSSSLLGTAVANGVYYYFYERGRGIILKARAGSKALSTPESMLIGLIAGSATTVLTNPIWVIQTSQTVRTMSPSKDQHTPEKSQEVSVKKQSFLETISHILQKGGITEFWRGLGPALVLVMNPVLQYTVFEQMKNLLIKRRSMRLRASGNKSAVALLTDLDFFFLGALSKLVATSITYPYIVIKFRLQAGSRYKSAIDGLLTVLREEGIAGLYKGVGSKLTQSVLTNAILFASQRRIYETVKKAMNTVA